jgi:sugar-phosphatase
MSLSTIAAVLFDMDGTLVDSDAAVERAWRSWSAEFGVDPARALAIAHGSPADATVRRLLPDLDSAAVAASAARQLRPQYDDLADVTATPGTGEVLAVLARLGLPWAVVTSADARLATARLGAAGIDPPVLVTSEDIRAGKPDPEGYLRAARLLGCPPARCLVVEDAEVGLEAGRAAGAMTAALKGLDGDLRLDDLAHLARLLVRVRPAPPAGPARSGRGGLDDEQVEGVGAGTHPAMVAQRQAGGGDSGLDLGHRA